MAYLGRIPPVVLHIDRIPGHGLGKTIQWMGNMNGYEGDVSTLKTLWPWHVVPFDAVLRKVMARFELHLEMREKYPAAIAERYRDFINVGRSLNFGYADLEMDI
jgi:hypothetical protein